MVVVTLVCLGGTVASGVTLQKPGLEQEVALRVGEAVSLADDVGVRFEEVLDDSRCPVDTTCIWAGDATVRLELRLSSDRVKVLNLHTFEQSAGEGRFEDVVVRLVRLDPARKSNSDGKEKYVATLIVSRVKQSV